MGGAEPSRRAEYIDTKRRMDTYRNKKQAAAHEIVQRWRKAVGKGGKDTNCAPALSRSSLYCKIIFRVCRTRKIVRVCLIN
ncbi:MAG: hypothetical protein KDJ71_10980 [Nitrobacter sp.]|nr:hypothetical protein [Nitrobacter sp.]